MLSLKKISIVSITAFLTTVGSLNFASSAKAGGFTSIRIGDADGLGYGNAAGYKAANGGAANVDGKGVLAAGDYIPDLNQNKILATGQGDDFDNRSVEEKGKNYLTGSGFTDKGSSGSQFTDISLSTSYLDHWFGTDSFKEQLTQTKGQLTQQNADNNKILADITSLNTQITATKTAKKEPLITQRDNKIEENKNAPQKKRAAIQAVIDDLNKQITAINNGTESEVAAMLAQKQQLANQQKTVAEKITGLNQEILNLNQEIKQLNAKKEAELTDSVIPLPGFDFNFFVAKKDIKKNSSIYFNLLFGDYDVKDAKVGFTTANGTYFEKQLTKQKNNKGQDGLIQSAFVELNFDEIFSSTAGGFNGFLKTKLIAPNEPYMAFDYAELSSRKISFDPKSVPEPTATLGLLAFGAFSANSARKRKKKNAIFLNNSSM
jgi:hypothetical protein